MPIKEFESKYCKNALRFLESPTLRIILSPELPRYKYAIYVRDLFIGHIIMVVAYFDFVQYFEL